MISFESDYIEGVHEKILKRLIETNLEQLPGYGEDFYTKRAKEKIKEIISCPTADIYFLVGGTQTNAIVISSMLTMNQGVCSASTGHINVHEAGAIEHTGHKVLSLPEHFGKINPQELDNFLIDYFEDGNREHMVYPGMVYISYPTEFGTLYSLKELQHISNTCKKYKIPLYIDGARIGCGIIAGNISISQIAELCDVFYIGGTKMGAFCGEAVIFTKNNTPKFFKSIIKQQGALLAKGRLLGIQFDTLFEDNLLSKHAVNIANEIRKIFRIFNYRFYVDSPTNQIFIIMNNKEINKLKKFVKFDFWQKFDSENTIVRFASSWATPIENVYKLKEILEKL